MEASPKQIAEYLLLRGAGCLLRRLPYRLALLLGWLIAGLLFHLVRFRRREAERRIRTVFNNTLSKRRVRKIAWRSLRNLCFSVVEMVRLDKLTKAKVETMEGYRPMAQMWREHQTKNPEQGAILATIHMGNWEQCGIATHLLEIPVFFIVRRQKNPLTNAHMKKMRETTGIEIIMNDSRVLRGILRRLHKGQVLAILPDVRARTQALSIDFLGGKANLGKGMAMFARQTGTPIYPTLVKRQGWTKHTCRLLDPITPDPSLGKEEDWQRMTQQVMDIFTNEIKSDPEQYFWYNKRWVLDPI